MNQFCKEFQKIHNEFNERIEEFQKIYDESKENGNVNLGGDKNFFEELKKIKPEIIKKKKLIAKTPEDINAETKIYLGKFENGDEEIFENLENPLFINGDVVFSFSKKFTKIPKDLVFNGLTYFYSCVSLREISENVVFNKEASFMDCASLTKISENTIFKRDAYFKGCTSLDVKAIEQLKQMKKTGKIKGVLTLPDGSIIR